MKACGTALGGMLVASLTIVGYGQDSGRGLEKSAPRARFATGLSGFKPVLAISSDGRFLAAKGNREVQVWDVKEGTKVREFKPDEASGFSIAISPDAAVLAIVGGSGLGGSKIELQDLKTGKHLHDLRTNCSILYGFAFSPKGELFVAAGGDRLLGWDSKTGKPRFESRVGDEECTVVSGFFEGGKRIATGGKSGTVKIWDVATGKPAQTLAGGHKDMLHLLTASADGKRLATAESFGPVKFWDVPAGKVVKTIEWNVTFRLARFLPSGKTIVLAKDKDIVLSDLEGSALHVLRGHNDLITDLALSADGGTLASISRDGTVCVWDLKPFNSP
jgi:tricorn protease-like protein